MSAKRKRARKKKSARKPQPKVPAGHCKKCNNVGHFVTGRRIAEDGFEELITEDCECAQNPESIYSKNRAAKLEEKKVVIQRGMRVVSMTSDWKERQLANLRATSQR